jgi:hypothetical protein
MRRDNLLKYGVLLPAFVCFAVFLQPHSGSQAQADGRTLYRRELGLAASPWFHYERVATPDGKTASIKWRMEGWTWSGPVGVTALVLFSWYWRLRRGTPPNQALRRPLSWLRSAHTSRLARD